MAYIGQDKKAALQPAIKKICKEFGLSASLRIRNHSTLILTVKSGKVDVIANYNETTKNNPRYTETKDYMKVNPYWYQEHFTGKALECVKKLCLAMNEGNHDNSDIQSDYFDVGWYTEIAFGDYGMPYIVKP